MTISLLLYILNAQTKIIETAPVDLFSEDANNLGYSNPKFGGDGYNHFRVCQDTEAVFGCGDGKRLHLGGCWYGAPNAG